MRFLHVFIIVSTILGALSAGTLLFPTQVSAQEMPIECSPLYRASDGFNQEVYDSDECRDHRKADCDRQEGHIYIRSFGEACVTLENFLPTLMNYILTFSSIIAGFMFLQGGYRILTSQGNAAAVAEGRDQLTQAAIGIVLIAVSYALIRFLNSAFQVVDGGINLLGPFGF